MINRLIKPADNNIPKYTPQRFFPRPQWNAECSHAWRERERLYRRYKDTKSEEVKLQWKRMRAIAKNTFRLNQKKQFQLYLNTLTYNSPLSHIYNKLGKLSGRPPRQIHFLNNGQNTAATAKEISDCLGTYFQSISNYENHSAYFKDNRHTLEDVNLDFTSDNNEPYTDLFSIDELKTVLHTGLDTSPGPDQINYRMIKELPDTMHQYILSMFNIFWKKHFFPDEWRKSIVIAFLKPNKPSS